MPQDTGNGDNQPPKNISDVIADTNTMLTYSANINKANLVPEYSTKNPATISDSPSHTLSEKKLIETIYNMIFEIMILNV